MVKYVCNVKRSLNDPRDYIYIGSINKIKVLKELDYRSDLMTVRDQGSQGTCYAHTASCVKEWQERKNYGYRKYFSPQFFYNNRFNKYDDNKNNDDGMYSRDVMKLLKTIGICSESSYPYGKIEDKSEIPESIYKEARKHIIKSYAKVTTINNLKKSLCDNGPCLITFPVYNYGKEFWKWNNSKDHFKGGHAVTIVGYNKNGFIIRNSWGINWANEGYSNYNYKDWGKHWEIWTTIDEHTKYKKEENVNKSCCNLI